MSFFWILEVVRHLGYKSACYLKLPGLMKTHDPWMRYKSWQHWWIKLRHQLCLRSSNIILQRCPPPTSREFPHSWSLSQTGCYWLHKVSFGIQLLCPFNKRFLWFCSLWQILLSQMDGGPANWLWLHRIMNCTRSHLMNNISLIKVFSSTCRNLCIRFLQVLTKGGK